MFVVQQRLFLDEDAEMARCIKWMNVLARVRRAKVDDALVDGILTPATRAR